MRTVAGGGGRRYARTQCVEYHRPHVRVPAMTPHIARLSVVLAVATIAAASGGQPDGEFPARVTAFPPSIVFSAVFSPDGKRLALACHDRTIQIHDAQTFERLAVLRGHSERVWSVAFTADGNT